MPDVTGYTAERMKTIEDACVVNGEIVSGNLHLTRFNETIIDAGYVGGIITCTSSTRPPAPTVGTMIYETDTNRQYFYDGAAWVQSPRASALGVIASIKKTTSSGAHSVSAYTDLILSNVSISSARNYKVSLNTTVTMNAAGCWELDLYVDAVKTERLGIFNEVYGFGELCAASCIYQPVTTGLSAFRVYAAEVSGTATLVLNANATGLPRTFWVEDIGPRVP